MGIVEQLAILGQRGIPTTTNGDSLRASFDVVVDRTGESSGLELARRLTGPRGTLALKFTFHAVQLTEWAPIVIDELSIFSSRCWPFAPALRLLSQRLVDVDSMTTDEFPFEQALRALEHAGRRGAIKIQVVMT